MLTQPVNSLLNLAENYIVANFDNVESLGGFPETMAESLFARVASHCQLVNKDTSQYLNVFVAAYGSVVLSSLNLPSLTILNEYLERIACTFPHLTALDLGHCHLGKSHDIFTGFQFMNNLKILLLNDCALENESLRKMTIPCRVSKTGLLQLSFLDIADNPKLTAKCLSFLICLRQLKRVNISTGAAGMTKEEVLTYMKRFDFEAMDAENVDPRRVHAVLNEGWAAHLVQNWLISGGSSPCKLKKEEHNSPSKFYGRPKRIKLDLDAAAAVPAKNTSCDSHLCMVRRENMNIASIKSTVVPEKPTCFIPDDVLSGYLRSSSTNTKVCGGTKRSPFDYL